MECSAVLPLVLEDIVANPSPLQYKGGSLFELYKGKGSHADQDMYRLILLADCVGKLSARAKRYIKLARIQRRFQFRPHMAVRWSPRTTVMPHLERLALPPDSRPRPRSDRADRAARAADPVDTMYSVYGTF